MTLTKRPEEDIRRMAAVASLFQLLLVLNGATRP